MKLHAIAAAITGKLPDQTKFTCTTIAAHSDSKMEREILSDHTFSTPIDLSSTKEVETVSSRLVEIISGVVAIQATFIQGQELRQVPLIIGVDSRQGYDMPDLLQKIFGVGSEKLEASKRKLCKVFDQIILEKGSHLRMAGSSKEVLALRTQLEEGRLPYNEKLVELKKCLDSNAPKAFAEIIEFAKDYGIGFADLYKQDAAQRGHMVAPLLIVEAPWDDYAERPDLQERFPIYCFTTWDSKIRDAVTESFTKELGIKQNVYLKPATEGRSPFFTDVAMSMIWDQFDVSEGRRTSEDITPDYDTAVRKGFLPRFKEIYAI